MINERGILFSTMMVQALLAGRKTQTRRTRGLNQLNDFPNGWTLAGFEQKNGKQVALFEGVHLRDKRKIFKSTTCPYGVVGDLLYVRETWMKPPEINAKMLADGADTWPKVTYIADEDNVAAEQLRSCGWTTKPGIHMPKRHSRIWLQLTDVQVERLQSICEKDAIAEGIHQKIFNRKMIYRVYTNHGWIENPRISFATLWANVHGNDSWRENPWVWVLTFNVLSVNGRPNEIQEYSSAKALTHA